ncbi:C-4 methylsterol oxidase [Apiospora kogelbergensis]|uniref:C-4 methylsterol oxidase n=1 Tax=Apiospora kogelbergensis TaxID=1337665 RepID=UPI00312D8EC7
MAMHGFDFSTLGFNTTTTLPSLNNQTYTELASFAAAKWPHLSVFEQFWWAHYAYWQSGIIATGLLTFWSHEIVYFGRCLPWMIADSLPSIFLRYKIQDTKQPSAAVQWECTKFILLIHFLVEMPLIVLFHPLCELFGLDVNVPFPRWTLVAFQIGCFFLLEDTYHYWMHRLLHWGPLYRKVHRIHHQYAAPFGLAAEYASPWETLLLGLGTIGSPLLYGAITGNVHLLTVISWVTLRQLQAIDAHSGYDFPWSLRHLVPLWGGSDWHDDHHRYFIGNYSSSFRYWDILMGTVAGPEAGAKRRELRRQKQEALQKKSL